MGMCLAPGNMRNKNLNPWVRVHPHSLLLPSTRTSEQNVNVGAGVGRTFLR